MATKIIKETRKRGLFGWIFLLIFIGFNLLMLAWLVAGMGAVSENVPASEAGQAGHAIGSVLGLGMVLFVWAAGGIITGLLAFFTRGKKILVEETIEAA